MIRTNFFQLIFPATITPFTSGNLKKIKKTTHKSSLICEKCPVIVIGSEGVQRGFREGSERVQ